MFHTWKLTSVANRPEPLINTLALISEYQYQVVGCGTNSEVSLNKCITIELVYHYYYSTFIYYVLYLH